MTRRSRYTREELRARVIDEAEKLVRARGRKGLTARHLAEAIGIAAGHLYNLFRDLDEIILHVNERLLTHLDARLAEAGSGVDVDTFRRLTLACHDVAQQNPGLWGLLTEHTFPNGYEFPHWYQDALVRPIRQLERALAGGPHAADAKVAALTAQTLWSCILGITSAAPATFGTRACGGAEALTQIERLVELCRGGLGGSGEAERCGSSSRRGEAGAAG